MYCNIDYSGIVFMVSFHAQLSLGAIKGVFWVDKGGIYVKMEGKR